MLFLKIHLVTKREREIIGSSNSNLFFFFNIGQANSLHPSTPKTPDVSQVHCQRLWNASHQFSQIITKTEEPLANTET